MFPKSTFQTRVSYGSKTERKGLLSVLKKYVNTKLYLSAEEEQRLLKHLQILKGCKMWMFREKERQRERERDRQKNTDWTKEDTEK